MFNAVPFPRIRIVDFKTVNSVERFVIEQFQFYSFGNKEKSRVLAKKKMIYFTKNGPVLCPSSANTPDDGECLVDFYTQSNFCSLTVIFFSLSSLSLSLSFISNFPIEAVVTEARLFSFKFTLFSVLSGIHSSIQASDLNVSVSNAREMI